VAIPRSRPEPGKGKSETLTWTIDGNSNIDATRFLGTKNAQPLANKTNQLANLPVRGGANWRGVAPLPRQEETIRAEPIPPRAVPPEPIAPEMPAEDKGEGSD